MCVRVVNSYNPDIIAIQLCILFQKTSVLLETKLVSARLTQYLPRYIFGSPGRTSGAISIKMRDTAKTDIRPGARF